ncbi:hypothetical protein BJ170DRAFT_686194 [Xylariales sp. AK1849]|nr:hypothetical protein BJ170DRAFT_686194 [Xylariales sp. AK1849]
MRVFLILSVLVALISAYGFLDQNCGAFGGHPQWQLSGQKAETYCNDHVCNENAMTALDLNRCIGNDNGNMVFKKDGHFGWTCGNCLIEQDSVLNCICAENNDQFGISKLGMRNGEVYNWFGYLSCFEVHETEYKRTYPCQDPGWQPAADASDTTCNNNACTNTLEDDNLPDELDKIEPPVNFTARLEEFKQASGLKAY